MVFPYRVRIMNEVIALSLRTNDLKFELTKLMTAKMLTFHHLFIQESIKSKQEELKVELEANKIKIQELLSIILKGRYFGEIFLSEDDKEPHVRKCSITQTPISCLSTRDLNNGFVSLTEIRFKKNDKESVRAINVVLDIKAGVLLDNSRGVVK